MPTSPVEQKAMMNDSEEKLSRHQRLSYAIDSVKDRPPNRRGPYILSDDDFNQEFLVQS